MNAKSLAMLIVGLVLLIWGVNASESVTSTISEAFDGAPSDKAIWLLSGGLLLSILGLAGLVRGSRS